MEEKISQFTACEKKKIKKMINLIYIVILPLMFTGLVLILSVNKLKINKYECIDKTQDVFYTLEEKYYSIPYVLEKYFSHIIDIRRNLPSSIISKSYWYENIEIYNIKMKEINRKDFNKINTRIGVGCSLIIYWLLMIVWSKFDRTHLNYQNLRKLGNNEDTVDSINSLDVWLGLDALSLPFILLTGFIMPIVYLSNWTTIDKYNDYYVIIVLGLEVFLLGVFLVIDLLMFYIFFESILPLLFVLIGLYGAAQKFRAGYYLFLYTLLGSLFMLLSFVKLGGDTASTFFECYADENTFQLLQQIIWTVLFVSFSVKTPLVPVHIWLPLAHSDANVSGSIILASIVLKLALYGFIRILIGIFYLATARLTSFFLGYCSMSLVFSSFTTIRQFDLKVLVAYSSIAHMASSLLGTFSDTLYGLIGSVIFGLAHGFVSPGLFIIVGAVLYDRCGTRIMNYFKGLSNILPFAALIFLILVFGNMGVPLTGNFIGEFMSLIGAYQQNIFIATIGTISVITSAIYSINTFNKTTSGSLSPYILTIPDLFRKEYYTLLPLIVLTLILGIYPSFISSDIEFGLSSNLMLLPFIGTNNINSNNENNENNDSNNQNNNNNLNSINRLPDSVIEDDSNIDSITESGNDDIDNLPHDGIIPPHNSPIISPVKPGSVIKPDSTKAPNCKPEFQEGKGPDYKPEGSSSLAIEKSVEYRGIDIDMNNNDQWVSTEITGINEIDIVNDNYYFIYSGADISVLIESLSYLSKIKVYLFICFYVGLIWQNKDLIKYIILNIYENIWSFVSRINKKIRKNTLIGLIVLKDDIYLTLFDNIINSTIFHLTIDLIIMNVLCSVVIVIVKWIIEMNWIQYFDGLKKLILSNKIIGFIINIILYSIIIVLFPILPHLLVEIGDLYFYHNSLYDEIKDYIDSYNIRCDGLDDNDYNYSAPGSGDNHTNAHRGEDIIEESVVEDNNGNLEKESNIDPNNNKNTQIDNLEENKDLALIEKEALEKTVIYESSANEQIENIKEDLQVFHEELTKLKDGLEVIKEVGDNTTPERSVAIKQVSESSELALKTRDIIDSKVNDLEKVWHKLNDIKTNNPETEERITNSINQIADFINGMYPADTSDSEGYVESSDEESHHHSSTSESDKNSNDNPEDDNSDEGSDDNLSN